MHIELNVKPLSVNDSWKGRRFKTDLYKKYERDLLLLLPKMKGKIPDMIAIDIHFVFSSKASDIDNPVKPLLDILQKKYGFDDKNIFELNIRKSINRPESISINIRSLLPFG